MSELPFEASLHHIIRSNFAHFVHTSYSDFYLYCKLSYNGGNEDYIEGGYASAL